MEGSQGRTQNFRGFYKTKYRGCRQFRRHSPRLRKSIVMYIFLRLGSFYKFKNNFVNKALIVNFMSENTILDFAWVKL